MEITQITLKVKNNNLQSMKIDNGTIQGANAIVKALTSHIDCDSSDSAGIAAVVQEIIEFERLARTTEKQVSKLDRQIERDMFKENKKLEEIEKMQIKLEKIKQGILSKRKKREELCDRVRNNGYYSRGIKR